MTDFSVLMSVYFAESPEHFHRAMKSIWDEQDLKPSQIVIVKDGPVTPELDKYILDWKVRLKDSLCIVELVENSGLGIALNEGLKHCRYSLVARMDADDISMPSRFRDQVSCFDSKPNLELLGSWVEEFDLDESRALQVKRVPERSYDIEKFIKYRNPFNHPSVMYRKESVFEVGGYMDMPQFEDYFLWARMVRNNGVAVGNLPKCLVRMRAGLSQMTRRRGLGYIKSEFKFYLEMSKLGLISKLELIPLLVFRLSVRMLPQKVLGFAYRLLRKF